MCSQTLKVFSHFAQKFQTNVQLYCLKERVNLNNKINEVLAKVLVLKTLNAEKASTNHAFLLNAWTKY
jgi:hypothetical protein